MKDKKVDGLPPRELLPAYLNRDVQQTSQRRTSFRRAILVLLAVVYCSHLWARGFLSTSFYEDGRPRHRREVLFGKNAEKYFLTVPNNESSIAASRLYAAKPHMAGTDGDLDTAKEFLYLLQRELAIAPPINDPIFPAGSSDSRSAILDIKKTNKPKAWIDVYYPVLNSPLDRSLSVLDSKGKVVWEADLEERADDTDPDAGKYSQAIPAFHGLSAAGDVTGKLIHANYGLKDDYDTLLDKGVNFTGSIVLVRYGGNFRGLKIKGAQEVGAAGVLIYSDPKDDGSVTIKNGYEAYPHGPARNPKSVQRGSVQFLSMYPGDPTTPGYPSYENSTRTEGENIPKIPSLPISWKNAKKLLDGLDKKNKTVRLVNNVDTKVTPIWNTMAIIPGYIRDEVVVIGNHRDAWVMGAADPTSGTASIHETIRGLGALVKKGWKPLRTILIASWDAEEYGLIGSTEWGEDFAEWINANVVAYLNLDGSASGSRFSAQASPLIAHLVQKAALDVPHPTEPERTLWDARSDSGDYFGADGLASLADQETVQMWDTLFHPETQNVDDLGVGVLGSGSDYTVFLQRIGVASMNHGFGTTSSDPVYHYHSVYDSERWMEKYGDPGFFRHVAVAKHLGLLTLRVASDAILPFNTTHYANEIGKYLEKVEGLVNAQNLDLDLSPLKKSIRKLKIASQSLDYEKLQAERELKKIIEKWRKKNKKWRKVKRRIRRRICRIRKKMGWPCKERHPRRSGESQDDDPIEHWPVEEQHAALGLFAHGGMETCSHVVQRPHGPFADIRKVVKRIRAVNTKLRVFERGFISEEGIPEREWFKHLGVAPGKWLGYGATTLPALTESITIDKNSTLAKYEVKRLTDALDGIAEKIAYRA